jgi:hypothetical protein
MARTGLTGFDATYTTGAAIGRLRGIGLVVEVADGRYRLLTIWERVLRRFK